MKIGLIAPAKIPAKSANTIQVMKNAIALTDVRQDVILFVPGQSSELSWQTLASHYGLVDEKPDRLTMCWVPRNLRFKSYDYALNAVQMAKKADVDCIFTRLLQAAALSSARGVTTYYEAHDIPTGRMGPVLFKQFLRGKAKKILISISDALLQDLKKQFIFPDDLVEIVASDGVDLARFGDLPSQKEARVQLGIENKFTAGFTGHLYAGRGEDLLIGMAALLPEFNFLVIGGKDDDVQRVQNKIESQNLKNMRLMGFIPNAELPVYQTACDCLLMPYQEKIAGSSGGDIAKYLSPMKMFEYLASAKPILSSDLPVLREVLDEENSILLPFDDVIAWVDAIRLIKKDSGLAHKLSENAFKTAKQYTWQIRVSQIFGFVDER